LVFAHVSSMKTRRAGSILSWCRFHQARRRAMSETAFAVKIDSDLNATGRRDTSSEVTDNNNAEDRGGDISSDAPGLKCTKGARRRAERSRGTQSLNKMVEATANDSSVRSVVLTKPLRRRDREHLKFVGSQPCLLCGRQPSDAHNQFAQEPDKDEK
jgi:hypothetical protein